MEIYAWRNRPLGRYQYLMLDARYEHVRQANAVVSSAVLIAIDRLLVMDDVRTGIKTHRASLSDHGYLAPLAGRAYR